MKKSNLKKITKNTARVPETENERKGTWEVSSPRHKRMFAVAAYLHREHSQARTHAPRVRMRVCVRERERKRARERERESIK